MANEVIIPFQQFKDDGGHLVNRGTLEFFENGQEVVQLAIFSDSDLTVAQSNPYELDDFGRIRGDVHYSGLATAVLTNAAGLRIRRYDDMAVSNDGDTGSITVYRASVAAMVSDNALTVGTVVRTAAYFANVNLGGARYLVVAAGTGTVDSFLFHQLGNGLQAKLLDVERNRNYLVAGARGDGGTNDTVPMQAVINAGGDIEVEGGFIFEGTNLTIAVNVRFVGGGEMRQAGNSSGDFIQILLTTVTSVKFKDVILDGNQQNGNQANATVGWVLS